MAPPPLPRRHSVPTNTKSTTTSEHRRYSDYKNPKKSKLDLRQELINLNLNNQEVKTWLGNEYEEKQVFDYEQFQYDIPLQRSVSLDGGIEIFKYLQTVGSDWSGSSVASSWSVDSAKDRMLEKCRSFEDIPASQNILKSGRASSDADYTFNKSLGLSVLRTSYKDLEMESGNMSPRIKKLQRMFSFRNTFKEFKEISNESLYDGNLENEVPTYKDISFETKMEDDSKEKNFRRRKHGIQSKYHMNLRKEVLKQNVTYASLQDLSVKKSEMKRRGSAGNKPESRLGLTLFKDSYKGFEIDSGNISPGILKLKKSFSILSSDVNTSAITTASESNLKIVNSVAKSKTVNTSNLVEKTADLVEKSSLISELIVSNSCSFSNESINLNSKTSNLVEIPTDAVVNTALKVACTSNLVDVSRNCGCRMCREEGNDETSFLRRIIKSFMKILYGSRKLMYWDENNNLNESETLACLIQVLKFLFGLWLRNLDHN